MFFVFCFRMSDRKFIRTVVLNVFLLMPFLAFSSLFPAFVCKYYHLSLGIFNFWRINRSSITTSSRVLVLFVVVFRFIYLILHVTVLLVHIYVPHMPVWCYRGQKKALDPLELLKALSIKCRYWVSKLCPQLLAAALSL